LEKIIDGWFGGARVAANGGVSNLVRPMGWRRGEENLSD
jgi:hypothetical protein